MEIRPITFANALCEGNGRPVELDDNTVEIRKIAERLKEGEKVIDKELIGRMDFEPRIAEVIPMLKDEYHLYGTARLIEDLKYCLDEACGRNEYNKAIYDFSREISDKIIHEIDDCADELEWVDEVSKFLKNSHFTPLIPVKRVYYADVIVTGTKDKPYYQIKYREIGKKDEFIGYGSYDLKLVFRWLEDYFEIVEDAE